MAALNRVTIIGNLTRDPESRQAGETKVSNFGLAVNEKFKDRSGQQQEKTEFINVVCWGRQAEIADQYLKKGSSVYVEGKLETRSWDDKDSGKKMYKTEVRCLNFQMLGGRAQEQSEPAKNVQSGIPLPEDGLPF